MLHPGRAGTWGPVFIGAYGVGLVIAGIFGPDPSMGFPPGAPEGIPTSMSTHSAIHGAAFLVSLVGLVGSCIVFARRFASLHRSGWVTYCVATAVAAPVLIVLSNAMMSRGRGGLALFGVAIVMSAWLALLAVRLLADRSAETPLLRGAGRS